jgi:predicted aspartyl protease
LGKKTFVLNLAITFNGLFFSAKILADTGANGYIFVNLALAKKIKKLLKIPIFSDFVL